MEFNDFLALHESQLKSAGIPPNLWPHLHTKLVGEIFDAGQFVGLFRVEDDEEEEEEEEGENDGEVNANTRKFSRGFFSSEVLLVEC